MLQEERVGWGEFTSPNMYQHKTINFVRHHILIGAKEFRMLGCACGLPQPTRAPSPRHWSRTDESQSRAQAKQSCVQLHLPCRNQRHLRSKAYSMMVFVPLLCVTLDYSRDTGNVITMIFAQQNKIKCHLQSIGHIIHSELLARHIWGFNA